MGSELPAGTVTLPIRAFATARLAESGREAGLRRRQIDGLAALGRPANLFGDAVWRGLAPGGLDVLPGGRQPGQPGAERAGALQRDTESAGRLCGAIEAAEAAGPIGQWEAMRAEAEAAIMGASGPDFERGRAEGRFLTLAQAAGLVDEPEPTAGSGAQVSG